MNEILSNPDIMYCVIGLIVTSIGVLGVYISKRFKITKKDADLFKLIINTVDYVTQNYDVKYKGDISTIVKYVYESLDLVNKYSETVSLEDKQKLVKNKALSICQNNNIRVNNTTIILVDDIADYVVKVLKK